MKRREFIRLLGGAAAAWPLAARAQQPAMPVVGFLHPIAGHDCTLLAAFREGLEEPGYIEGRTSQSNIAGRRSVDQLPGLAADLVRREVRVIPRWRRPPHWRPRLRPRQSQSSSPLAIQ